VGRGVSPGLPQVEGSGDDPAVEYDDRPDRDLAHCGRISG